MPGKARPAERYVGLISGTSMDGIDAVVVDFSGARPRTEAAITQPFDASTRALLDRLRADPEQLTLTDFCQLDAHLGESLAQATLQVLAEADLAPADVTALGSHGQTVPCRGQAPLHAADRRPPPPCGANRYHHGG